MLLPSYLGVLVLSQAIFELYYNWFKTPSLNQWWIRSELWMLWVFYDTARCRLPQKGPLSPQWSMVTESDTFDQTIFIRSWLLSHKMYQVSCLGLNLRPHKRKTVHGWQQMIRCDDPRFWSSLLIQCQSWCGCQRLSSSAPQNLSTVSSIITPSLWRCPPRVQTDPVLANLGPPAAEMRTPLRFLK